MYKVGDQLNTQDFKQVRGEELARLITLFMVDGQTVSITHKPIQGRSDLVVSDCTASFDTGRLFIETALMTLLVASSTKPFEYLQTENHFIVSNSSSECIVTLSYLEDLEA